MANTIKIKNSGTASAVPSSLEHGELGLNYADGKIYFKNSSNVIVDYGTVVNAGASGATVTVSDTAPSGAGVGDIWYESDTGKMFVYYDSFWVEASGSDGIGVTGATGATGTVSLASPAFTGTPTAPTATAGTNTTQLATTAFVKTELNPFRVFNLDLLIVAGGGPGGWDVGGGGGAGGFIFMRGYQIWLPSFTSVPVVVGAGGVAATANHPTVGTDGGNSSFGNIIANGGGYGASYSGGSPNAGGSGGGGGGYTAPTNGAMGFIGQGFAGGTPSVAGNTALTGSGGGGAGGPGANGILNAGGAVNGGNGAISNISGSNVIYCTGGKGGSDSWTGGAAGAANTGNGGDGAGASNGNGGYNGGSGIVIVRYLTSDATGLTITGGTATTDGSYTVRTFSTVGSTTFSIS